MHESLPCEFFHAFDVDRAPYAMRLSRCETDAVAHVVDPPANAVDPTIAECAVDSLGPGDARFSGILLVKSDQQFLALIVVFLKPVAPIGRRREEGRSHFIRLF